MNTGRLLPRGTTKGVEERHGKTATPSHAVPQEPGPHAAWGQARACARENVLVEHIA
jgi:hypothetical protein